MKYAINLNSISPVRADASERSEMVTQLLFGEICEVIGEDDSFVRIENYSDKYQGWVDKKMLSTLSDDDYNKLREGPVFKTNTSSTSIFCLTDRSIYHLSVGSSLPFYDHETSKFEIAGKCFQIHSSVVTYISSSIKDNVIESAMLFLNSPYLWGGKSIMGIDCSGLVQIVYSLSGFNLPRDASQQVKTGISINSFEDIQCSDLLFFEKNGKIIHVGIYIGENKVIHASGKVRIDDVDDNGIFNRELGAYTHKLSRIRRI